MLLVDDGKVALQAVEVTATDVITEVIEGGVVSNNKGINLPGVAVSVPALSDKDEADLRWALRLGADMIALSFVRDAKDIVRVHEIMDEEGVRLPVIAKIEKPQAVDNLTEIIDAFDGVMVARGDLGVELPLEEVPLVQKRAIEIARRNAKPVIVATQVLESMIENSRPTRAEASDCANAVLDGADAIMLSGETSVGKWPIEAVRTMAKIIESTEEHGLDRVAELGTKPHTTGGAVTAAAAEIGDLLGAKYLVTFTDLRRLRQAALAHPQQAADAGVHAQRSPPARSWRSPGASRRSRCRWPSTPTRWPARSTCRCWSPAAASRATRVVIVAGSPPGIPGSTNALRVHHVGDAVNKVAPAYEDLDGPTSGPDARAGTGTALTRGGAVPAARRWYAFAAPAGVVEWQTRGTQNALPERACGFKSRPRHEDLGP